MGMETKSKNRAVFFHYLSPKGPKYNPFLLTPSTLHHEPKLPCLCRQPYEIKNPKTNRPSPHSAFQTLKTLLLSHSQEPISPDFKVLPFRKGKPLAGTNADSPADGPNWHLGWLSSRECKEFLENSEVSLSDLLVYLGCKYEDDVAYCAIDVSDASGLVSELVARQFCFVELRTLMVATDWADAKAMGELSVAGHILPVSSFLVLSSIQAGNNFFIRAVN